MTRLPVTQIRLDGGTQPRAQLDLMTIAEYAAEMKAGAEFPPVIVFYDGTDHWLSDGFHRVKAAESLGDGLAAVEADVRQGTRRDAILYSASANVTHGLRRTNADKRRAVVTLLADAEWQQWSDNEIARRCAVSAGLVGQLRAEIAPPPSMQDAEIVVEGGDSFVAIVEKARSAAREIGVKIEEGGDSFVGSPAERQPQSMPDPSVGGKSLGEARRSERVATAERTVKRQGKTYKMKTAKIGKHKQPAKKTLVSAANKAINMAQIAGKAVASALLPSYLAGAECPGCHVMPYIYRRDDAGHWACDECGTPVVLSVALADPIVSQKKCRKCGKPVSGKICANCGSVTK